MYQTESENSSYDAATMRKLQEEVERAASNYESERQQYEDTYSTVEDRKSSSLDLGGDRPMPVSSSLDRLAKGIVDLYERLPVRLGLRVVLILLAFFITTFGISVEGDLDTGVGVMHLGFVNGDVEFVPIGAPGFSALQFMGVWTDLTVFVLLFPKIDLGKKLRMVMLAIAATFVYQITRGTLITAISRSLSLIHI